MSNALGDTDEYEPNEPTRRAAARRRQDEEEVRHPRFTYKHYYRVADLIRDYVTTVSVEDGADLIERFAAMFEADNERFSRDKFVSRCTRIETPEE